MTIDEAIAAIRADPWCPRDATDEQVRRWAELSVQLAAAAAANAPPPDRRDDTITTLKIALEQAADRVEHLDGVVRRCAPTVMTGAIFDIDRWREMAKPDWEALPVELTGGDGPITAA
jgi:hypothetical protein